jgi:hypothetical protein
MFSDVEERPVRIGCGAGFAGDRIEPAADLANRGALDFLFFECLAERTLALSQVARAKNVAGGYNTQLERRFGAVLPGCRDNGTRIVTNMGAANPEGAGQALAVLARRLGFVGLKIAIVEGDDVQAALRPGMPLLDAPGTLADCQERVVGANAYLGADVIVAALETGADVVITGRVADPSLVVGPLMHTFGWRADDWQMAGAGTLVGHLLECSCQVTGGYFADPGHKDVPDLAYVGYPYAEVRRTGKAVITKLEGTGGCVTPLTVKEQLLYEVHDPAAYLTPDVIADFSRVSIRELARDRVAVAGADGRQRPDKLKVIVGFDGGLLAEAGISYAGPGAVRRARLAEAIIRERMLNLHRCREPLRFDLIGQDALHGSAKHEPSDARDVRLRVALRSTNRELCETLLSEVEAIWIAGPAGGGGVRGRITPTVTTRSLLIERELVSPRIKVIQA